MTDDLSYTFNWQESDLESIEKWILPHILVMGTNKQVDELSDLTDKFRSVKLEIKVNGVEANAKALIDGLVTNFDYAVAKRAEEIVQGVHFDELVDAIDAAQFAAIRKLREALKDAGIELPERE